MDAFWYCLPGKKERAGIAVYLVCDSSLRLASEWERLRVLGEDLFMPVPMVKERGGESNCRVVGLRGCGG